MRQSMTGFASVPGEGGGLAWVWEIRGVNGKGLDLRLRLPDGIDGLDAEIRKMVGARLTRGNIQVSLKLQNGDADMPARLDTGQMQAALDAIAAIETDAMARGITLAPSTAADVAGLRGVLRADAPLADPGVVRAAVLKGFDAALDAFVQMRASEGAALMQVMTAQLDEIAALTNQAGDIAETRRDDQAARLRSQLAQVLDAATDIDEPRIAQELALIAVKSDITEELDRLRAHVGAARDLLAAKGAMGRKLDFLMQEFNREANTLCSKAGHAGLTQVGLSLKTVIDQMREQVQNVE